MLVKEFKQDMILVKVFSTPEMMGKAAAFFVTGQLIRAIGKKGSASLILATGTSQYTFIEHLQEQDLDWKKITVFHLDEYLGLPETHPASFRKYLKERILDRVKPGKVHYINGDEPDTGREIEKYEKLLLDHPVDIACIGIGENGHIAFNDPPVADFNDPKMVKTVELDEACKNQQMNEGWFGSLDEVPEKAITLTIPAIMKSRTISCVVPDKRKSDAVYNALYADISEECPASILRTHPDATLFLDTHSAGRI